MRMYKRMICRISILLVSSRCSLLGITAFSVQACPLSCLLHDPMPSCRTCHILLWHFLLSSISLCHPVWCQTLLQDLNKRSSWCVCMISSGWFQRSPMWLCNLPILDLKRMARTSDSGLCPAHCLAVFGISSLMWICVSVLVWSSWSLPCLSAD